MVRNNATWLCLRFTHFGLNSLGFAYQASTTNQQMPDIAVTYQQTIYCANSTAILSGVKPGMSISHALLLNPWLQLHQREPHLEQQKIQELSQWAYSYTSLVSQYNEHVLILEIGKSETLFKSLKNILKLIENDLMSFKIESSFGLANTPKAAVLISYKEHKTTDNLTSQIDSIPLNIIDQPPSIIAKLQHCGFEKLNDIKHIKHGDLGVRFGKGLLIYLRQVYGDLADPQEAIIPPEIFEAYVDFSEPISNSRWIHQEINKLLNELSEFIEARQLLCRSFIWRFFHENNRLIKTINIGINNQQDLNNTLKQLTSLKLEKVKLTWEFSRIELSSKDLVTKQLFNTDLFDTISCKQPYQQLKDKLISRLGNNAVYGIDTKQEYLPEMAHRQHKKGDTLVKEQGPVHYSVNSDKESTNTLSQYEQPLWLLSNPTQIKGNKMNPNLEGPLFLIHGPNRLSSQWWLRLQSRDYFIARQKSGRLLWIFFDRVKKHWFLHGLFG